MKKENYVSNYYSYSLIIVLVITISSCSSLASLHPGFNKRSANGSASIIRTKQFTDSPRAGTLYYSFYDATKRSSITYVTPEGQLRTLSENNPDAAVNRAFDLISKINITNGKDTVGASNQLTLAKTIVQLTQKSPTDILVRDALYRLNEMYLNTLCLNCGNNSDTSKHGEKLNRCDTCSQSITRGNYVALFSKVLSTAEVISASDAKIADAKVKELQILDSARILKDSISYLKDSISKLNQKPISKSTDPQNADSSKEKKTSFGINHKNKNSIIKYSNKKDKPMCNLDIVIYEVNYNNTIMPSLQCLQSLCPFTSSSDPQTTTAQVCDARNDA